MYISIITRKYYQKFGGGSSYFPKNVTREETCKNACILISFNGIYYFIFKSTNHSFSALRESKNSQTLLIDLKEQQCELDLLQDGNIFFYFPRSSPESSSAWSFFLLHVSSLWISSQISTYMAHIEDIILVVIFLDPK